MAPARAEEGAEDGDVVTALVAPGQRCGGLPVVSSAPPLASAPAAVPLRAWPLAALAALALLCGAAASARGARGGGPLRADERGAISRMGFASNALMSDRGREPGPPSEGAPSLDLLREFLGHVMNLTYSCEDAERVGADHDGGYVWCNDAAPHPKPEGGCTLFGYGIDSEDEFEQQVAEWGCQVHEFDPTVERTQGEHAYPDRVHFHREGAADAQGTVEGLGPVDSMEHHMQKFGPKEVAAGDWLAVKMDIEEAEWLTLSAAPDSLLERLDILIVEFHQICEDEKLLTDLRGRVELLRRLKELFYVYHVHANNWGDEDYLPGQELQRYRSRRPFPGSEGQYYIPAYAELSFVRKASVERNKKAGAGPFLAHRELDHRNAVDFPAVWLEPDVFPLPPAAP